MPTNKCLHRGETTRVTDESDDIASRVRAKCIAHLGTVESHQHSRVADMAVISDVGQIGESIDGTPGGGVKRIVAHSYRARRRALLASSRYRAIASDRLMAPILRRIRFTCVFTVSTVMTSSSAISALEAPRISLSNT
jgi:hypothetical protein